MKRPSDEKIDAFLKAAGEYAEDFIALVIENPRIAQDIVDARDHMMKDLIEGELHRSPKEFFVHYIGVDEPETNPWNIYDLDSESRLVTRRMMQEAINNHRAVFVEFMSKGDHRSGIHQRITHVAIIIKEILTSERIGKNVWDLYRLVDIDGSVHPVLVSSGQGLNLDALLQEVL